MTRLMATAVAGDLTGPGFFLQLRTSDVLHL